MGTRYLPGTHSSLNDLSQLPEGQSSLTVGYVLKAKRGPIGECQLVVSPSDFLAKYTFSGKPSPTDDSTFHNILDNLRYTNQMYISRAAKNALYGGLVIKKETTLGNIVSLTATTKAIVVSGDITTLTIANDIVRINGISNIADGRYTIVSATYATPNTTIIVKESIAADYTYTTGVKPVAYKTSQPKPISSVSIGAIYAVDTAEKKFTIEEDKTLQLLVGDKIQLKGGENEGIYTILSRKFITEGESGVTEIEVSETIKSSTVGGTLYRHSLSNPEGYAYEPDDLCLVTGIDQGIYNENISVGIESYKESPTKVPEPNSFIISFYDNTTNTMLESFTVSRNRAARAIDGTNMYVEDVIESAAYVRVYNNEAISENELPCNTLTNVNLSGGYDGDTLTEADTVAALELFADKTIPISLLGNGDNENATFQQAMIAIADSRKDIFFFLNSRKEDENATLPSVRAQKVAEYKKSTLGSTSFYGCMYATHAKIADTFNSRNVIVGMDAKAISGWLNIINTKGFPYAYAGPSDGLVSGSVCPWKVGDESGEATLLNDASINYTAYDPKVGRYYMQTQNTLQIANSSMRNIGTVLNVLDIKENFMIFFKEFLQKPITDDLRKDMMDKGNDFMNGVKDNKRITNFILQDVATDTDVSNNTLRFLLTIAPTPYAQNIYLIMNIVKQSYDFSILQAL